MKKTLGQIAFESRWQDKDSWDILSEEGKAAWQRSAKSVERAVLRRLKEGKKK